MRRDQVCLLIQYSIETIDSQINKCAGFISSEFDILCMHVLYTCTVSKHHNICLSFISWKFIKVN